MSATAEQVAQLRRMVNEPDETTYDDDALRSYIERNPLVDADGNEPDSIDWTATYDLHLAAASIWDEKAALLAGDYDFAADGGEFSRSQAFSQAIRLGNYHRARRSPRTVHVQGVP